MSIDFGSSTGGLENGLWQPREQRSGLTGFGGRPVLHPAWREPVDRDVRSAPPAPRLVAASRPRPVATAPTKLAA